MNKLYLKVALMLLVVMMGMNVQAQDIVQDGLAYEIYDYDSETGLYLLQLSWVDGDIPTDLVIPATVNDGENDLKVTRVGDGAFYGQNQLQSVTLGANVKEIGDYAFAECYSLSNISLNEGLETIGMYAFVACPITEIALPSTLTFIAEGGFYNDNNTLTKVIVLSTSEDFVTGGLDNEWSFSVSPDAVLIVPDALKALYSESYPWVDIFSDIRGASDPEPFAKVGNLWYYTTSTSTAKVIATHDDIYSGDIVIPATVEIENITYQVTEIAESAFYYSSITSVDIEAGITTIPNITFRYCSQLSTVTLPATLTSISTSAFWNCNQLATVTVNFTDPAQCRGAAFLETGGSVKPTIIVPDGTREAFKASSNWSSFVIREANDPEPVIAKVGTLWYYTTSASTAMVIATQDDAYSGDIVIPATVEIEGTSYQVTEIAESAFAWNENITTVVIEDGITTIPNYAFNYCTQLSEVTLPAIITFIAEEAFVECYSLTKVVVPFTDPYQCDGIAFANTYGDLPTIVVPDGTKTAFQESDTWGQYGFKFRESSDPEPAYYMVDGLRYYCDVDARLVALENGDPYTGDIVIPATITVTAGGKEVTYSVTEMDNVFQSTGITSVDIQAPISIIDNAFSYCSSLEQVTLGENVSSLGRYAFRNCPALKTFIVKHSSCYANSFTFSSTPISSARLIVPDGAISYYQSTGPWNQFGRIREVSDATKVFQKFFFDASKVSITVNGEAVENGVTVKIEEGTQMVVQFIPAEGYGFDYLNVNGVNKVSELSEDNKLTFDAVDADYVFIVEMISNSITFAAKYMTFCSKRNVDFTDTDVKAWAVTGYNDGRIQLSRVYVVPANTGVLLEATAGTSLTLPFTNKSAYFLNMLMAVTDDTWVDTEGYDNWGNWCYNFILGNGSQGIGFYRMSEDGDIAGGKAYLPIPQDIVDANGSRGFKLQFEGESTGIDEVSEQEATGAVYTLGGVRVEAPAKKGIYMRDGKKFIVK